MMSDVSSSSDSTEGDGFYAITAHACYTASGLVITTVQKRMISQFSATEESKTLSEMLDFGFGLCRIALFLAHPVVWLFFALSPGQSF